MSYSVSGQAEIVGLHDRQQGDCTALMGFYLAGWQLEVEDGQRKQATIEKLQAIVLEQAKLIEAQREALAADRARAVTLYFGGSANDG